jgi:hypothetical protein
MSEHCDGAVKGSYTPPRVRELGQVHVVTQGLAGGNSDLLGLTGTVTKTS